MSTRHINMTIVKRLINSYKSGGIREIIRKIFYHFVYRINNLKTKIIVENSKLEYGIYTKNDRKEKIIISLTSFPERFETIDKCLKSLLLQKIKPNRIIVYLGKDTDYSQITNKMHELEKYGIEYRIDSSLDLRAHKKYFYAMQEFYNDIIVTADDDLYYPTNWLESLLESYKKYPNCVSARRVHRIKIENNKIISYNNWEDQCRKIREPSKLLLATGGSGALYPPHILSKETFNVNNIMKLCYEADDVWLKCMEILNDINVVWVPNFEVDQIGVEKKQKNALSQQNVDKCQNDIFLEKMMKYYSISCEDFYNKKG